jgi:hypothetical protein
MRVISDELKGGKLKDVESLVKNRKKVMPFVSEVKNDYEKFGSAAFRNESPVDQSSIIKRFKDYIQQTLGLSSLEIVEIQEKDNLAENIVDKCGPMRPLIMFES